MLRLYMDVRVKAAITAGVWQWGIDVVTAQEDGACMCAVPSGQRSVDHCQDTSQGTFFVRLNYGNQLAATIGKYVLNLAMVFKVLDPEDMANRIESLPLA